MSENKNIFKKIIRDVKKNCVGAPRFEVCVPNFRFTFISNLPKVIGQLETDFFSHVSIFKYQKEVSIFHYENDGLLAEISMLASSMRQIRTIETFMRVFHVECFDAGSNCFVYFPTVGMGYVVLKQGTDIFLITTRLVKNPQQFVRHIYRELLLRLSEDDSRILFHSAMVSLEECGIMILGPSHSGKTTFLLSIIEELGASFISNDRTILSPKDFYGTGFPLPIRIGLGTLIGCPRLYEYISKNIGHLRRPQMINQEELDGARNSGSTLDSERKLELEPGELSAILNIHLMMAARVKLIIIPQIHPGDTTSGISKVAPGIMAKLLINECYTPEDPLWKNPWLHTPTKSGQELLLDARRSIEAIVAKINGIRIDFGYNFSEELAGKRRDFRASLLSYAAH